MNTRLSRCGSFNKGRPIRVRIGVMGAAHVGKTSIVSRLQGKTFSEMYEPTIEDLYTMYMDLGTKTSKHLELLDTAGAYDFPAMRRLAINTCHIFMLVYRVNDLDSFHYALDLFKEITNVKNAPILFVGNKIDLNQQRDYDAIRREVDHLKIHLDATVFPRVFQNVSAKEGLFMNSLMKHILTIIDQQERKEKQTIIDQKERKEKQKGWLRSKLPILAIQNSQQKRAKRKEEKGNGSLRDHGDRFEHCGFRTRNLTV